MVAMMGDVTVGAVIVSFNSGPVLQEAVAACAADSVLVVDNASTTRPVSARVLRLDVNVGYGAAANRGARCLFEEGCTHVLLMNADVVLAPGALESMLAAWHPRSLVAPTFSHHASLHENAGQPFLSGACLLLSREDFTALGGFAEDYFHYFEDAELSWAATMLGYDLVVASGLARHEGGDSLTETSPLGQYYYQRNQIRFLRRIGHSRFSVLRRTLSVGLARDCLALRSRTRGESALANALLRAHWDALLGRTGQLSSSRMNSVRSSKP